MTKRQLGMITAVLLLVGVNVWHWWPAGGEINRMESNSALRQYRIEDYALRIPPGIDEKYTRPRRDLFQAKATAESPTVKKTSVPAAPPPKTPEQLAEEAAQAELAQIKLVGVVFRAEKGQAYLVRGEEAFLVFAGDKVGSRFIVESISTDAVELKDPVTAVSKKIPVSGK